MSEPLGILDLLELRGFDREVKAKLVRHQEAKYDIEELRRQGWFELYQSIQGKPVFHKCDVIVVFVGTEGTKARFVGVYDVLGKEGPRGIELPPGSPFGEWALRDNNYVYRLEQVDGYEDLEDRVIIEWGKATRSWHQRLRNKEVVEVLPPGHRLVPFADYLDFTLTWEELCYLTERSEAHRDWRSRLEAVSGVYLVLDVITGKQYVGSASGTGGVWSRWVEYATNGHGGNVLLRKLVSSEPKSYPKSFRYSLLQVLPKSTARSEVVRWEKRYKEKLGTLSTGLNLN